MTELNWKNWVLLHVTLLVYSVGAVLAKSVSEKPMLSLSFISYYCAVLACLIIYAVLWQQVLKKMSLSTAYANKSVVVIWGMVWGYLFFHESITLFMGIGAIIIFFGVYLVVSEP